MTTCLRVLGVSHRPHAAVWVLRSAAGSPLLHAAPYADLCVHTAAAAAAAAPAASLDRRVCLILTLSS